MIRAIDEKLIDFIDQKISHFGLAQYAITSCNAKLLFGLSVRALVGVQEMGGNNMGSIIELMQKTIGTSGDGAPWCASFIESCLAYAEKKTGILSPTLIYINDKWGGVRPL